MTDYSIKTIIVGDSSVGKSNILTKFVSDEFNSNSCPTIGVDYKSAVVNYGQKTFKLLIWDTAGQERFNAIVKTFYKDTQVVILVFDITNHVSFDNIEFWINQIKSEKVDEPIFILVGNKLDIEKKRVISKEEAIKKTTDLKLHGYFECSAKNNICIEEIFLGATKLYSDMKNITDTDEKNLPKRKKYLSFNLKKEKPKFFSCYPFNIF